MCAISPIGKKENILDDNIGYVEKLDFSKANLNDENRLLAITTIASICYQNPKGIGKQYLYDRLIGEANGLPSSSFEFVPVLIDALTYGRDILPKVPFNVDNNLTKFGEWVEDGSYLLTNYRAVYYMKEKGLVDFTKHYNTEAESIIINRHFHVFKMHIDFPTRSQLVRHRVSFQELSRRYVDGDRVEFEFLHTPKLRKITSKFKPTTELHGKVVTTPHEDDVPTYLIDTAGIFNICLNHYHKALEDGVKPEEARRIIPQAGYTTIYAAMMPTQIANFFKLRSDTHAQKEIRKLSMAMEELMLF